MEMVNDLSKNGGSREVSAVLSDEMRKQLISGYASSVASTPMGLGGKPLLRLLKDGRWVFGQQDDEVQAGSEWVVNPLSVQHGWSCWSNYPGNDKNKMLKEVMVPVTEPKPAQPADIDGFPFREQRIFEARCLTGEDTGMEVLYKVASYGGVAATADLLVTLSQRLRLGHAFFVPVVQFDKRSYQHAKWGTTLNPVFTITGWADMNGNREPEDGDDEAAPAASTSPSKPPLETAERPGGAPRRQRPVGRV
jgi:hypothetical protein